MNGGCLNNEMEMFRIDPNPISLCVSVFLLIADIRCWCVLHRDHVGLVGSRRPDLRQLLTELAGGVVPDTRRDGGDVSLKRSIYYIYAKMFQSNERIGPRFNVRC